MDKLEAEFEGIVSKAIKAYSGLVKRGYRFTIPESSHEALMQFKNDNDPVYQFVNYALQEDVEGVLTNDELFQAYESLRLSGKLEKDVDLCSFTKKTLTEKLNKLGLEIKVRKIVRSTLKPFNSREIEPNEVI